MFAFSTRKTMAESVQTTSTPSQQREGRAGGARWSFVCRLGVALVVALVLWSATRTIVPTDPAAAWWLELVAWLCVTCTYVGFVPAEMLGPRQGFVRRLEASWTPNSMYTSVFASITPFMVGVAIMGELLRLPLLAIVGCGAFVFFHFVARHLTTEAKLTPHLGQRGESEAERNREVWLAQVGDALIVTTALLLFAWTDHPLWLFSAVILVANYMLGLWVHKTLDPRPYPLTSYLAVLCSLCLACGLVLLFAGEQSLSRMDVVYGNVFLAAVLAVTTKLVEGTTVPAMLALGGLAVATLYGLLVSASTIPTGVKAILLNAAATRYEIRDYAVFLATTSFALNLFLANLHHKLESVRARRG